MGPSRPDGAAGPIGHREGGARGDGGVAGTDGRDEGRRTPRTGGRRRSPRRIRNSVHRALAHAVRPANGALTPGGSGRRVAGRRAAGRRPGRCSASGGGTAALGSRPCGASRAAVRVPAYPPRSLRTSRRVTPTHDPHSSRTSVTEALVVPSRRIAEHQREDRAAQRQYRLSNLSVMPVSSRVRADASPGACPRRDRPSGIGCAPVLRTRRRSPRRAAEAVQRFAGDMRRVPCRSCVGRGAGMRRSGAPVRARRAPPPARRQPDSGAPPRATGRGRRAGRRAGRRCPCAARNRGTTGSATGPGPSVRT